MTFTSSEGLWRLEELGLKEEDFVHLMADEELMGPSEELRALLTELRRPTKAATRLGSEVQEMPRASAHAAGEGDLVHEAFMALDVRRRGYLGSREFRRYAELTGYDGGDELWAEEFSELCSEYGWSTQATQVLLSDFRAFIGDAPIEELRGLLTELRRRRELARRRLILAVRRVLSMLRYAGAKGARGDFGRQEVRLMSRKQLKEAVFHSLDRRKQERLDSKAMRVFAKATGFAGSEEEWSREFRAICQQWLGGEAARPSSCHSMEN